MSIARVHGIEPFCRTISGTAVHFKNPKPYEIKISDIAWHLARTCRYQGHTKPWYSNAEHSIIGMGYAPNKEIGREFLIHDAAEFVFGDMPAPVKHWCTEYKLMMIPFEEFLNDLFLGYPKLSPQTKMIDERLTSSEMRFLRSQPYTDLYAEPYMDFMFHGWGPDEAYEQYMKWFQIMFPEYKDAECPPPPSSECNT